MATRAATAAVPKPAPPVLPTAVRNAAVASLAEGSMSSSAADLLGDGRRLRKRQPAVSAAPVLANGATPSWPSSTPSRGATEVDELQGKNSKQPAALRGLKQLEDDFKSRAEPAGDARASGSEVDPWQYQDPWSQGRSNASLPCAAPQQRGRDRMEAATSQKPGLDRMQAPSLETAAAQELHRAGPATQERACVEALSDGRRLRRREAREPHAPAPLAPTSTPVPAPQTLRAEALPFAPQVPDVVAATPHAADVVAVTSTREMPESTAASLLGDGRSLRGRRSAATSVATDATFAAQAVPAAATTAASLLGDGRSLRGRRAVATSSLASEAMRLAAEASQSAPQFAALPVEGTWHSFASPACPSSAAASPQTGLPPSSAVDVSGEWSREWSLEQALAGSCTWRQDTNHAVASQKWQVASAIASADDTDATRLLDPWLMGSSGQSESAAVVAEQQFSASRARPQLPRVPAASGGCEVVAIRSWSDDRFAVQQGDVLVLTAMLHEGYYVGMNVATRQHGRFPGEIVAERGSATASLAEGQCVDVTVSDAPLLAEPAALEESRRVSVASSSAVYFDLAAGEDEEDDEPEDVPVCATTSAPDDDEVQLSSNNWDYASDRGADDAVSKGGVDTEAMRDREDRLLRSLMNESSTTCEGEGEERLLSSLMSGTPSAGEDPAADSDGSQQLAADLPPEAPDRESDAEAEQMAELAAEEYTDPAPATSAAEAAESSEATKAAEVLEAAEVAEAAVAADAAKAAEAVEVAEAAAAEEPAVALATVVRPPQSEIISFEGKILDKYLDPGTQRPWFHDPESDASVFPDRDCHWKKFQHTDGNYWWWHEVTGNWFHERSPGSL